MKVKLAAAVTVLAIGVTAAPAVAGNTRAAQPAPVNDDLAAAAAIDGLPFTATTGTKRATAEAGEPLTCGDMRKTVWYSFTPESSTTLTAIASSEVPVAIATYTGTSFADLQAVGCSAPGESRTAFNFVAEPGRRYLFQVAAAARTHGIVSFGLDIAEWEDEVLYDDAVEQTTPGVTNGPLVVVDGRQSTTNSRMYEIRITAAGQPLPPLEVNTQGQRVPAIHEELGRVDPLQARVELKVTMRHDPNAQTCEVSSGGTCLVGVPFDPSNVQWLIGKGMKATLKVEIRVVKDGAELLQLTQEVPLVGQLGSLLP